MFSEFGEDKGNMLSAAFAYIAVFAIGPLLLIMLSIVGFVLGEKAASGQLYSSLNDIFGADTAKSLQDAIARSHESGASVVAFIVGVIGSLLAASGLSNQLQNSFNIIYDAVPDPKASIKRTIYTKLKNVSLVAGAGVVVVASVILSSIVSGVGKEGHEQLGIPLPVVELLNSAVSVAIFVGILYLIYKTLPDVYTPKKVTLGAAATVGVLFLVGKIILGFVIGNNATASAYGAAASIIALLLWFYYTAQILLLGAEGIKVYGDNHALVYKPKKYTLKRRTITIDLEDNLFGRSAEKFVQGFKKARKTKK